MNTERIRRKIVLTARASSHHVIVQALSDEHISLEACTHVNSYVNVKTWLRLLAYNTQIEQQICQCPRTYLSTTLPRSDYLAQLGRHPDGLRMNVLSRYPMVTGGNTIGLTDQSKKEGLVGRGADPDNCRLFHVPLTDAGRRHFVEMAAEHERWLIEMSDGPGVTNKNALHVQFDHLRVHLAQHEQELDAREDQP